MPVRLAVACILPFCRTAVAEEWQPPLPPVTVDACAEQEINPVVSYRISGDCRIVDIRPVGGYQSGTGQVMDEVRAFERSEVVKRFALGEFQYLREVTIELRRALEPPEFLVCHSDMMKSRLLDAVIRRAPAKAAARLDELIELDNGRLPDLGIFTHTSPIMTGKPECPQEPAD